MAEKLDLCAAHDRGAASATSIDDEHLFSRIRGKGLNTIQESRYPLSLKRGNCIIRKSEVGSILQQGNT